MELAKITGITPGSTDLNRDMGALPAIHLSANHTLCILNRDSALGIIHKDDDPNQQEEDQYKTWNQTEELASNTWGGNRQFDVVH